MLEFLAHMIVTAALLMAVAYFVKGVEFDGWGAALIAALVFAIVNAIVKPLVVFLTIPLTVITLGLFLFVVNALMFKLTAWLVPGFQVRTFGAALVGSVLLSLMNLLVNAIT